MRKQLSDEQLEAMGRMVKQMHSHAMEVWKIAVQTIPIKSYEYRQICRAGKAVQDMGITLQIMGEERNWSDEKIRDIFPTTWCGFS